MRRGTPLNELAAMMSRHRLIEGWDPRREPRVAMISIGADDNLGAAMSLALAGLGARRQIIHRDGHTPGGRHKPGLWRFVEGWLDDATLSWREGPASPARMETLMESLAIDVYVDATGCCTTGMEAAVGLAIPAWSVTAAGHRIWMCAGGSLALRRSRPAAIEACLFAAGLVADDFTLRLVLGRRRRRLSMRRVRFDLSNPWGAGAAFPRSLRPLPRPLRLLMAGAGGLGCPAGLALAEMLPAGSRVVVADPDHIEPSNRNRQFLFSRADAESRAAKAEVMCRRLSAVRPEVEWVPLVAALPALAALPHGPYDAVLTLTDTLRSRVEIDGAEMAPVLVNAGSSIRGANAALFHSGGPRLSQVLRRSIVHEATFGRASCDAAQPSIISTNFIGAALAVALLRRHVMVGAEPARSFSYDQAAPTRGGAYPPFRMPSETSSEVA